MTVTKTISTFHGGLKLKGNKQLSTGTAITAAAVVSQYIIPLQQHIGAISESLVSIGEHVLKGQMIAKPGSTISAAVHAPVSGTITAIDRQPVPHVSGLPDYCITIDNDFKDKWVKTQPLAEDYNNHTSRDLRQLLRDAGIVGLGGATFPSDIKETEMDTHTLILNGVECEPYITCDDMLMRERAQQVLAGADIIGHIIKAHECIVAIENNKPEAIKAMQAVIDADGTGFFRLQVIPTLYPSGGEKQLIKIITGKEVPSGHFPGELDVLCHNVATAYAIYQAIYEARPLISRIMTVTGHGIQQPQNIEVLIGTPMKDCIEQCGGYINDNCELIMGGPMMGLTLQSDHLPVIKATNCLLIRPCTEAADTKTHLPCIRCGKCVEVCPVRLLPQQLYWYTSCKNMERVKNHHLFDCIECGCCAYVCPSDIPLVQYYRFAKTEIRHKQQQRIASDTARQHHEAHQQRLERQKQEREQRLRKKREMLAARNKNTDSNNKEAITDAIARAKAKKAEREQAATKQPVKQ